MKKIFLLLLTIIPLVAFTQKANIKFEKTNHNFGKVEEKGGLVSHDFVFTNTGNAPLILINVRAGCGCTTPEWSREPIAPGQTGLIKVSFNPLHRPGNFSKTITVSTNTNNTTTLKVSGTVINTLKTNEDKSTQAN